MLVPESKYIGRQTRTQTQSEPEPETWTETSTEPYPLPSPVRVRADSAMSRRCIVRSESLQVPRAQIHTHTQDTPTDRQSECERERGRVWVSETAFHQRWQTHRLLMASVVVKRLGRQLPDIDIWDASLCLALTRFFTRSPPHHPFPFLSSLPFSMTLFHFECPVHANLLPHTPLMPILSFL